MKCKTSNKISKTRAKTLLLMRGALNLGFFYRIIFSLWLGREKTITVCFSSIKVQNEVSTYCREQCCKDIERQKSKISITKFGFKRNLKRKVLPKKKSFFSFCGVHFMFLFMRLWACLCNRSRIVQWTTDKFCNLNGRSISWNITHSLSFVTITLGKYNSD